jgi:hypothetical protein
MDTTAIYLTGAFESKGHLYHIISDTKNTYLGYLNHKKIVVLDTIASHPSWYYGIRDLQNNPNLFIIRNSKFNGVIVREKNKIRLIKFKN